VDVTSFEQFADTSLVPLLRLATVISGDRVLAEDLVQDVMLKAQRRWSHIATLDLPEAYARRMLVNEYLSWRRKFGRIHLVADIDETAVSDHANQHALRDELRQHLQGLPRQQQVVLALRYYLGLADAEIAGTMGCTEGTVRGYASRGLAALRASMRAPSLDQKGTRS
jgi:RNA polymerase sigma-70 factor (sigma-E family)